MLFYDGKAHKLDDVTCFLIAPEERGKGIAQLILEKVCEDAKAEGYTYVEAYPFTDVNFGFQFHGTRRMYEKSGFVEVQDLKFINVMNKKL
ncbi:Acetyltransferase (GNAT) family protein [[Clostridium] polysaccharolyticum]|uniref:Acetyltransferase (GNAT) family protein n=1 Tax=[Clostridium] polysaccharolyticum TaxID=29364 RepID=A0A1I0FCM8_9FIRM|nr:Acetyltransferase (GNAT) family protein [[Clostridium] polysaccharolyticum]